MEDELTPGVRTAEASELEAYTSILANLQKVDADARARILRSAATFFGISLPVPAASLKALSSPDALDARNSPAGPLFSEDRTISPKQFMLEKKPQTDVEKVACLAYYLTHYKGLPNFKTLDISKLNTEAAQAKFSNPTVALDNAGKMNYVVSSTRGSKRLYQNLGLPGLPLSAMTTSLARGASAPRTS